MKASRVDIERLARGPWTASAADVRRRRRVPAEAREEAPVRRAFTRVAWLLGLLVLIGAGAVGEALDLVLTGDRISGFVWWRLVVVFLIATTLFYFRWRAMARLVVAYSACGCSASSSLWWR